MSTPASILKNTFGYDDFRPLQREVIENVLARRDTLTVMPTGGGKSLCYQIPSLIFEGLTVVVSPLISLMKDQVEQLGAAGVPAVFLNSSLPPQEYQANMERVKRGQVRLLYVAPETLLTPRILTLLGGLEIDCLTIDEAHCISEWGHDFRPEYRQIAQVRQRFPGAVCLALTATATARVRQDIRSTLTFSAANEFVASFNRANLHLEVVPKRDPLLQTVQVLKRHKDQPGIIYCFSRRQVDELAAYLASRGVSARPYHAGLEDGERRRNQEAFIRDDAQVIVATIAFGMGINKPNVRFVVHFDLPKSIEGYYQEIGRAGRDGLPADCLLLYSYSDAAKIRYFIEQKKGAERRVAQEHLDAIVRYAEDESNCRRKPLLAYFGELFPDGSCSNCDNCTSAPAGLNDVTDLAHRFLESVKRAGERFGASHIANILLGSKNQKVLGWKHDQLSTYGKGRDLTQKQWMHLARQLVQTGYLRQDGEFHTLALTGKGSESLKNRTQIMGALQPAERVKKGETGKVELEYDQALFSLLRQRRKDMADAAGVPPYVIFSDKTLAEMAAYFPQTGQSLLAVSGVGQVKMRQYGEAFLGIIQSYCGERGLEERPHPRPLPQGGRGATPLSPRERGGGEGEMAGRTRMVAEAYNAGESLQSLMDRYQVTAGTILEHLARFAAAGNKLRSGEDLGARSAASPEQRAAVFAAFEELGTGLLKPVFLKLNETVSYDELKILRLLYLISRPEK